MSKQKTNSKRNPFWEQNLNPITMWTNPEVRKQYEYRAYKGTQSLTRKGKVMVVEPPIKNYLGL